MADPKKLPQPAGPHLHGRDGGVHEVQTLNIDLLMWDRTRARRKWPTADEAPNVWLTFVGWAAMKREGADLRLRTLEQFEEQALSVQPVEEEKGEEQGRGPYPEGSRGFPRSSRSR